MTNNQANRTSYLPATTTTTAPENRYGASQTTAFANNSGYTPSTSSSLDRNNQASGYGGYSTNTAYNPAQQQPPQTYVAQGTQGAYTQRPDSVSSGGSIAPPPQRQSTNQVHYSNSHAQRRSQDFRTGTRSPLQPQAQQQRYHHPHNQAQAPTNGSNLANNQNSQNQSPNTASGQQASATASGPVTVDPSQVYDRSAEIQREAAKAEAARRAEENRKQAERERELELERKKREDDEHQRKMEEARKLSRAAVSEPQKPKQKRARKPKVDKSANGDAAATAAAMTLMQSANSAPQAQNEGAGVATGEGDLEAQMKDMFAKMREFNAKNPDMLSKMWQQERENYLASQSAQQKSPPQPSQQAEQTSSTSPSSQKKKRTPKKEKLKSSGERAAASTNTAQAVPAVNNMTTENVSAYQAPATKESHDQVKESQAKPVDKSSSKPSDKSKGKATIWPETRKKQLAEAASTILLKMPEHNGRTIPAEEIAALLDSNPSYLDLCNQIEKRGFRLNKSIFAKSLLAAVPEVNKGKTATAASPQTAQSSTFTPMNVSTTETTTQQRNALGDAENRLMRGESLVGSKASRARKTDDTPSKRKTSRQQPSESHPQPVGGTAAIDPQLHGLEAVQQWNESGQSKDAQAKASSPVGEKKKRNRPSISKALGGAALPPLPETKEDKARKRTFADLVDLTQLSDEETGPPSKRQQSNGGAGVNGQNGLASKIPDDQTTATSQLPSPPHTDGESTLHPPQQTHETAPAPQTQSSAPQVPLMGSHYPPPPQAQQPQGPHAPFGFLGRLQNYPQPKYPPPMAIVQQPVKPAINIPRDHPANHVIIAEKITRSKALRRSRYNPKTIARDVLLASNRHPDMRHLNAHLDILHNLKLKDDTDLSTIRWDIIDPGGAKPGAGASTEPLSADEEDDFADDEEEERQAVQSIPTGGGGGAAVATVVSRPNVTTPSFKMKKFQPRSSDLGFRNVTSSSAKPRTTTGTPSSTSGYTALRAQQIAQDPDSAPRRGRPKGWRKWMQKGASDSPSASTPAPSSQYPPTGNKPRGRPPKATRAPSPKFAPFVCKWKDCGAELHNLETLRRHLNKRHGKPFDNGQWTCRWGECGKAISVKEGPRIVPRFEHLKFSDLDEWKAHIENTHLSQVKWNQGDGPSTGLVEKGESAGEVSDAVLSDKEGRQVTPRIEMPSSPAEARERVEAERAAGAQGPVNDSARRRRTPQEEARLELYAVEERRRRLGPGMDRGGSRIVNEKRRQGFVEDGDVEMVDASELI